jgi:hypothetical protein
MPTLEEIRDFVLQDWRSAKAEENRQQDYAKRRSRYTVEIIRRMNVAETESR